MASVAVQKVKKVGPQSLPIFETIEKRLDEVRRRAFELFEKRGYQLGHEIDDWLKAEHEVLGWPASELAEKDGKYEVQITLPGFEPNEVQVTATPSEIIVHAETNHEKKIEEPNVLWTEFGSTGGSSCRRSSTWIRPRQHSTMASFPSSRPRRQRPKLSLSRSGLPDPRPGPFRDTDCAKVATGENELWTESRAAVGGFLLPDCVKNTSRPPCAGFRMLSKPCKP
jgi:HSP20 family molecular chaperone IbpA